MRFPKESSKNGHGKASNFGFLSVKGMHSLLDVPKATTYNTTFFWNVVIPDLLEIICAESRRRMLKGVIMHLDNASPDNSRKSHEYLTEFRARRVPHPAYSPDLAPSDFFLFGKVKAELKTMRSTAGRI
jgi:hypothetical protein